MDIFAKNLGALESINSLLSQRLTNIVPNENLEVFVGRDPIDINFLDKTFGEFIFPQKTLDFNLQKNAEFGEFALYPYLYCFGLGNGIFYKMLLENKHLKRLIIIEPNIEILFGVLNLVDFSDELAKLRLILMYSSDINKESLSPFFSQNKNALIYSKLYNLHIFNHYYEHFIDEATRINRLFIEIIEHSVIALGNDSKDAITGIKHHIKNLPLMLETPTLHNLARKAKNSDLCVIVSTGPSLNKQLSLLKKFQDNISIFCIDASFPILASHGIKPDIVFSLERVELSAKFYEKVSSKYFKNVIFEITSIAHERLINEIKNKGGILQISSRPFGYTHFFELIEYGYLGIGMSAANMAYELMAHSGFSVCALIGQDLAFGENGASHSVGAVYGEREIKPKAQIYLPKYGGNGEVESTQVWKIFWNFFIKDIFETKDKILTINATEGGARIPYSVEMPFIEVLENFAQKKPKKSIVLENVSDEKKAKNLESARQKVRELLEFGEKKKSQIESLFLKIAKTCDELENISNKNPNALENYDFSALDELFSELEIIKANFSDKKFLDIFGEATQALIFHQEMQIAKIECQISKNDLELKIKKLNWLYAHKGWLFSLAGCIDSVLFCVKESFTWEE